MSLYAWYSECGWVSYAPHGEEIMWGKWTAADTIQWVNCSLFMCKYVSQDLTDESGKVATC